MRQRAIAFPGNAHAVMKAFNLKRLAGQQEAFAVAGNHFVKGDHVAVAVDFDQVALEALAAFVEGDDQRVVAFLQRPQVAGDFQGRGEHLGWLRGIFRG